MRWLVFALVAALSSGSVSALESNASENSANDGATLFTLQEAVVTPIPMPASVTVLLEDLNAAPATRPAKKLKLAKKKQLPKSLLSRTERHQIAILTAQTKTGDSPLHALFDEEDTGSGAEDLDLHRSYGRPQVSRLLDDEDDEADDDASLTNHVKIRLLMARMKAVEAHIMARIADQADDETLTDMVMHRLQQARAQAVAAHQKKFS